MVASCSVGFKLSLETMVDNYGGMYEPEIYPALYYYVQTAGKKVTLMVFHSGKVIATGAKTKEEIDESCSKLYDILCKR